MNDAYAYAEAQLLGTQFDPFVYRTGGQTYRWSHWSGPALAALVRLGLRPVARFLFARLVEVTSWQR